MDILLGARRGIGLVKSERVERRLAAIFAADMVGYSRLMEVDEEDVIARQKSHRRDLIDPKIAEYDGRIGKLMGDGMLIEFASVVNAVQCAIEIQQEMTVARQIFRNPGGSGTELE